MNYSKVRKNKKKLGILSSNDSIIRILTIVSVITALLSLLLPIFLPPAVGDYNDMSARIKKVYQDLESSSKELAIIQTELENRIELVENLKKEAEIAENVISLSSEQVNAIQAKLNQELNSNGNRSLIQSILVSGTFFILGIIIPHGITFFRRITKLAESNDENILLSEYSNEEIEQAIILLDALKKREDQK